MDKSIKKYLTKFIKESITSDMDEMATYTDRNNPKRAKSVYPLTGKEKLDKFQAYAKDYNNPNFIEGTNQTEFIPDYWLVNTTFEEDVYIDENGKEIKYVTDEGETLVIIPTTCNDEFQFKSEQKDWIKELSEKYGLKIFMFECKTITGEKPRNEKTIVQVGGYGTKPDEPGEKRSLGTGYKGPNTPQTTYTKNIRAFYATLNTAINENGLNTLLYQSSIPVITWMDKNVDSYSLKMDNNLIQFQTHNYNGYKSAHTFLNCMLDGFEEKDTKKDLSITIKGIGLKREHEREGMSSYHTPRLNTPNTTPWPVDRRMDTDSEGLTPVRKEEKKGKTNPMNNFDISTMVTFFVNGRRINETQFTWNIKLFFNITKKLPGEIKAKTGSEEVLYYEVSKTAEATTDNPFNDSKPIMEDLTITTTLIEAIDELKSKVKQLEIGELLPLADITYEQTTTVNESVERLIRRMVKQIKQ